MRDGFTRWRNPILEMFGFADVGVPAVYEKMKKDRSRRRLGPGHKYGMQCLTSDDPRAPVQ